MKLGNPHDEIKYDATYGTTARYVVTLDGQPTMAVWCDTADAEKKIVISDADGTRRITTKGRFEMKTKLMEDADGAPLGVAEPYVDRKTVYGYVLPRLHVLLGRLVRTSVECANCGSDAP